MNKTSNKAVKKRNKRALWVGNENHKINIYPDGPSTKKSVWEASDQRHSPIH